MIIFRGVLLSSSRNRVQGGKIWDEGLRVALIFSTSLGVLSGWVLSAPRLPLRLARVRWVACALALPDHKNRCNGPIFVLHALSAIVTVSTGIVTRVVPPPTRYAVVAFCHLCAASIVCRKPHSCGLPRWCSHARMQSPAHKSGTNVSVNATILFFLTFFNQSGPRFLATNYQA